MINYTSLEVGSVIGEMELKKNTANLKIFHLFATKSEDISLKFRVLL